MLPFLKKKQHWLLPFIPVLGTKHCGGTEAIQETHLERLLFWFSISKLCSDLKGRKIGNPFLFLPCRMFFDSETDVKREGDTYKFPHKTCLHQDDSKFFFIKRCFQGNNALSLRKVWAYSCRDSSWTFMHSIYMMFVLLSWVILGGLL